MTPMKMRHLTMALASLLLAAHCSPNPDSPSPNPADVPDSELCDEMCNHLRDLGCEEGQDYYDLDKPGPVDVPNATCEDFCLYQQANGVFVNPRCVMTVPSCEDIEDYRKMDCSSPSP
jgi:nitrous oxide reductase accessory protein NosL